MQRRILPTLGWLAMSAIGALGVAGCGGAVSSGSPSNPPPQTSPTITNFSPGSGAVGATVTVAGTNLTGATAVSFGGHAATFTVMSRTRHYGDSTGGSDYGNDFRHDREGNSHFSEQFHGGVACAGDFQFYSGERRGGDERDDHGECVYGRDERQVQRDNGDVRGHG